jgi:hypothetical protein
MDERDEQFRNPVCSIHKNLEPDSNMTVESDQHSEKHIFETLATVEGMQIDERDEQRANAYPECPIVYSRVRM